MDAEPVHIVKFNSGISCPALLSTQSRPLCTAGVYPTVMLNYYKNKTKWKHNLAQFLVVWVVWEIFFTAEQKNSTLREIYIKQEK